MKLFTLGSAVWVLNGFFVFLPSVNVMNVNNNVIGWSGFVGGSIFEIGSYLMVLESLNRKQVVGACIFSKIDIHSYVLVPHVTNFSHIARTIFMITRQPKGVYTSINNLGSGSALGGTKSVSSPAQYN